MIVDNNVTILVNSSDGFEDCWNPFFTLFKTYWQAPYPLIILNTETKFYSFDNLPIKTSRVNKQTDIARLTWSECLIRTIHQVKTPYILYFQEDYFLEDKVNMDVVSEATNLMVNNSEIKYIGLTHFGNGGEFKKSRFPGYWKVAQNAKYRISTQVALWRKETLLSYLRSNENGWMFEIFGSKRAQKRNELFITADRDIYGSKTNNYIFKYTHTGIIKGKWHEAMKPLFAKHNIIIDFSKRGFYKQKPYLLRKTETFLQLIKKPLVFINGMLGR